jgi:hypothetical protein
LGGACVAAPFLSSVVNRGAAKAQAVAKPKRLIVMFTHYGCITTRWFPTNSHGPLTADDLMPTTLQPLAPYVAKLLMPRGIRSMNEWTENMVRGQGNDSFLQATGSFLTCQPVSPNSDNPFSFDQSTKFNAKPLGPSLDHVIAQCLSADGMGTPLFIRVGNQSASPSDAVSYSAPLTLYPGLGLPAQVFSSITGLTMGGESMSPDSYQAARGQSVIDIVRDDLDALERNDMSQADKNTLEAWKALLHDTTTMMRPAQCNTDAATALGLTDANMTTASAVPSGGDVLTQKITDTLDGADIYSNLTVLAALCNVNPVIVLQYPSNYVFKGLGVTTESASLSGRLDNAGASGPCLPNAIDLILSIDRYYVQKFTNLVAGLDSVLEGDGTLLDNSATVWFQEVSDGCARNLNNQPIMQAGSCGGYFKTGWAVNVEDGSPTLTQGNSEAVCAPGTPNMVDALSQNTGTDPKVATAPINKYFYGLMNALGVKAGDDGFPVHGGTSDVTNFGMYDKTEDFIGGGTNPPTIHSPGEYTALKAGG